MDALSIKSPQRGQSSHLWEIEIDGHLLHLEEESGAREIRVTVKLPAGAGHHRVAEKLLDLRHPEVVAPRVRRSLAQRHQVVDVVAILGQAEFAHRR